MAIGAITALIRLGIPATRIIAKYGKKAFDAAKKDLAKTNKDQIKGLKQLGTGSVLVLGAEALKKLKIKKEK